MGVVSLEEMSAWLQAAGLVDVPDRLSALETAVAELTASMLQFEGWRYRLDGMEDEVKELSAKLDRHIEGGKLEPRLPEPHYLVDYCIACGSKSHLAANCPRMGTGGKP